MAMIGSKFTCRVRTSGPPPPPPPPSLKPRLSFVGGKEILVHCAYANFPRNPGNLDSPVKYVYTLDTTPCIECKLSVTLLCISSPPLAMLAGVCQRCGVNYFCPGKVPEPVGSRNFERQEKDLAIDDSVGLRKSSSIFEVLDDYFPASLFHMVVVVC